MKNPVLYILAVFAFVITVNAQEKLDYNLTINDSFKVEQKATQDIIQDMDGSLHEMKNELQADFTFVVKEVLEQGYVIDFTFDRFKMTTTSNLYGEIMNVDTDEEVAEDDMEAKIFAGLVNATLTMTMLKDGKIESIQGTEELVNKMIDGTGVEDEFSKQLMTEAMKKEFGNESLSSSFEQLTFIYPKAKVAVGDTWKNEYVGDLKAQNTWTLASADKSTWQITGESEIQMLTEEDAMTMTLNGTQNTTIMAGIDNGFVVNMKVTSLAKGTTVMKQMNSMEVPTTIKSITEYKIQ